MNKIESVYKESLNKQDPETEESPLQFIYQVNRILDDDLETKDLIKLIRETVSLPQDQPASFDEYQSRFERATEYVKYDRIRSNWSEFGRSVNELIAGTHGEEITWSLIESNNNAVVEVSPKTDRNKQISMMIAKAKERKASRPAGKIMR